MHRHQMQASPSKRFVTLTATRSHDSPPYGRLGLAVLPPGLAAKVWLPKVLEQGVDEWSNRGPLGQDNQASKEYEH
jgi:hypothetical protein